MSANRARGTRRAGLAAAVAVLIGLIATFATAAAVSSRAEASAEESFQRRASAAVTIAQQEIASHLNALEYAGAHAVTAGTLSPTASTDYAVSTRFFERFPTVTGLLYLRRVPESDSDAYVAAMEAVSEDFNLLDLGARPPGADRWITSAYVPGAQQVHVPLGIDLSSLPATGDQLRRAAEYGRPAAIALSSLPEMAAAAATNRSGAGAAVSESDIFFAVPSYAGGMRDGRLPDGLVVAFVRDFADHIARTANLAVEDLGFRLAVDLDDLALTTPTTSEQVDEVDGAAGTAADASFSTSSTFTVNDVQWTLDAWQSTPSNAVEARWLTLAVGGSLSLLFAWVTYLWVRARSRSRQLAAAHAEHARFLEMIMQSVADALVVVDAGGMIVQSNEAWDRLERPDGTPPSDDRSYTAVLAHRATGPVDDLCTELQSLLDGKTDESGEIDIAVPEGDALRWLAVRATPIGDGRGGAILVHSDITERRRAHDDLEHQARTDPLTGLANREALAVAYREATGAGEPIALLYIDLDDFKLINDTHGHRVGDNVLVTSAQRIRSALREGDVVARLGGDEFVALLRDADDDHATEIAQRITDSLTAPIVVDGLALTTAGSVGVARFDPSEAAALDVALEHADRSMYEVKRSNKDRRAGAYADTGPRSRRP